MNLHTYIRDIPDFPKPGILFKDITPLLKEPKAFRYAVDSLSDKVKASEATAVAAIESRGFLFACPIAHALGLPFIPIRKPGKLPYKSLSVEYSLEYGVGNLEMHEDAFSSSDSVVIVDDLLATGGTAKGAAQLIETAGAKVVGCLFVIELTFLHGKTLLKDYSVDALLSY